MRCTTSRRGRPGEPACPAPRAATCNRRPREAHPLPRLARSRARVLQGRVGAASSARSSRTRPGRHRWVRPGGLVLRIRARASRNTSGSSNAGSGFSLDGATSRSSIARVGSIPIATTVSAKAGPGPIATGSCTHGRTRGARCAMCCGILALHGAPPGDLAGRASAHR